MSITNTCVVCGRFSTRSNWRQTSASLGGGTVYVACDFHSQTAIEQAIIAPTVTFVSPANGVVTNVNKKIHEPPSD